MKMSRGEKMVDFTGNSTDEVVVYRGALEDLVWACDHAAEKMEENGMPDEAQRLMNLVISRLGYPKNWREYKPTIRERLRRFFNRIVKEGLW